MAVDAYLPEPTLPIVAEPVQTKINPVTDYDAKFSAQFVIATCLTRGYFGLADLKDSALRDPALRALAAKVTCHADPQTAFPHFFSGGVTVRLKDGREFRRHVRVNSGAGERALDTDGVSKKFRATAGMMAAPEKMEQIRDVILSLDTRTARDLGQALKGDL